MKITVTKIIYLALILILILILIPTAAEAQTPDVLTPAEENYCDQYSGRKFGICNAWYEAMDCNSSELTKASQKACDKLEAMLNDLGIDTSPSSEPATPCPCFDDLKTVFSGLDPVCSPLPPKIPTFISDGATQVQATASFEGGFNACIGPDGQMLLDISFEEASSCVSLIEEFCAGL